jgi:hypothetical protein
MRQGRAAFLAGEPILWSGWVVIVQGLVIKRPFTSTIRDKCRASRIRAFDSPPRRGTATI